MPDSLADYTSAAPAPSSQGAAAPTSFLDYANGPLEEPHALPQSEPERGPPRPNAATPGQPLSEYLHEHATRAVVNGEDARESREDFRAHVADQFPQMDADHAADVYNDAFGRGYHQNQLNMAMERHRGDYETTGGVYARSSVAFGSAGMELSEAQQYNQARGRFMRGQPEGGDYDVIASYERRQQNRANLPWYGKLSLTAAKLASFTGELGVAQDVGRAIGGGATWLGRAAGLLGPEAAAALPTGAALTTRQALSGALRGFGQTAALTPLMPSSYAGDIGARAGGTTPEQQAHPTNVWDLQNVAPAVGMAAIRNGILGAAASPTGGGLPGYLRNLGTGLGAQEFTKNVEGLLGLSTSYGSIHDLLTGHAGRALQDVTQDVFAFGLLGAAHGGRDPSGMVDQYHMALDRLSHDERLSPNAAAERLRPVIDDFQARVRGGATATELAQVAAAMPRGPIRDYARELARFGPAGPARAAGGTPEQQAAGHRVSPFSESPEGGPGTTTYEPIPPGQAAPGTQGPAAAPGAAPAVTPGGAAPEAPTTGQPLPNPVNSAGEQLARTIYGVSTSLDDVGLQHLLGLAKKLQGKPVAEVQERVNRAFPELSFGDLNHIADHISVNGEATVAHLTARVEGTPAGQAAAPEAPAMTPVQRQRAILGGIRDLPEGATHEQVQEVYRRAGYREVNGLMVHPDVGSGFAERLAPGTVERLRQGGVTFLDPQEGPHGDMSAQTHETGGRRVRGVAIRDEALTPGADVDRLALHELGHHVYQQDLTADQRASWERDQQVTHQYAQDVRDGRRISAANPLEEEFAERFAHNGGDTQATLTGQRGRSMRQAMTTGTPEQGARRQTLTGVAQASARDIMDRAHVRMDQAGVTKAMQAELRRHFDQLNAVDPSVAQELGELLHEHPQHAQEMLDVLNNPGFMKGVVDAANRSALGGGVPEASVRRTSGQRLQESLADAQTSAARTGGAAGNGAQAAQGPAQAANAVPPGGAGGPPANALRRQAASNVVTPERVETLRGIINALEGNKKADKWTPKKVMEYATNNPVVFQFEAAHGEATGAGHTAAEATSAVRDGTRDGETAGIQAADAAASAPGGQPRPHGGPAEQPAEPAAGGPAGAGPAAGTAPAGAAGPGFGKPVTAAEREALPGGGQEGAPGAGRSQRLTALANAQIDKERVAQGKPPLMSEARRANAEVWDEAMAKLDRDPEAGAKLVEELAAKPRATTVDENALLLHRRIALQNEHERAVLEYLRQSRQGGDAETLDRLERQADDFRAQLDQLEKVARKTGTEWGRAGQFRRQLAREDFSLGSMLNQFRVAAGREATLPEQEKMAAIASKVATTQQATIEAHAALEAKGAEAREALGDAPTADAMAQAGKDLALSPERKLVEVRTSEAHGAQGEFRDMLDRAQRDRQPWYARLADLLTRWRRFALLSGPQTLAKLTGAAVERMIFTPLEDMIGSALRRIPGLSKVAALAPREGGGFSWNTEGKAWASAFTEGIPDAWRTLTGQQSSLEAEQGAKRYPRGWLEIPGQIHGALKAPVKRAEYTRSLLQRIDQAARAGEDVTSPAALAQHSTLAYLDAERSIFQQPNLLNTTWKNILGNLEKGGPGGKFAAFTGRMLLPITKVPTNIVAEALQYSTGLVTGSVRFANAMRDGVNNLKPAEAEVIMRQLKKGSIGAAVMALAYMNPGLMGGFYSGKRKEGEPEAGSIAGVPAVLLHNPLLIAGQLGATIRRASDATTGGRRAPLQQQGLGEGLAEGARGLLGEVPFIRETHEVARGLGNARERGAVFGEFAKSMAVPQFFQWIAGRTDTRTGDLTGQTNRRVPRSILQHVEMGVPGLRQNVPLARR